MITLTPQQQEAFDLIQEYLTNDGTSWFLLTGYAGTGKTELAKTFNSGSFVREVEGDRGGTWLQTVYRTQFAAYTGKAASVMRKKGCIGATTIHSAVYKPIEDPVTGKVSFIFNDNSVLRETDLIVIDECSMCDERIARDLLSFNKPVVVIGDKAQLPPVGGAGYFIDRDPDFMLTEIHRQAADNPIIQASMAIRQGERMQPTDDDRLRIMPAYRFDDDDLVNYDQILVGTNAKRRTTNRKVRKLMGRSEVVEVGEKLICLRNDRNVGCYNGTMWQVEKLDIEDVVIENFESKVYVMWLKSLDEENVPMIYARVPEHFFLGTEDDLSNWTLSKYQHFTYGYAITVHKAQGSQWNNVLLYDDSRVFKRHDRDDSAKWLYTGVTRAAEKLTVLR